MFTPPQTFVYTPNFKFLEITLTQEQCLTVFMCVYVCIGVCVCVCVCVCVSKFICIYNTYIDKNIIILITLSLD